jgi:hypothetical protein
MSLNLTNSKVASSETLLANVPASIIKQTQPAWTRPSDWLPLPTPSSDQFVGLLGITNDTSNLVALKARVSTGTYTVDWGDGTITTNYASDATAQHQYSYSAISSTVTSAGFKQVIVKVYPTTGGATLNCFSLQVVPTGYATGASIPWLDIAISAPSMTSSVVGGAYGLSIISNGVGASSNIVNLGDLQQFKIVSLSPAYINFGYLCFRLGNLKSFVLGSPSITSNGTNFSNMFQSCYSLQSVPYFDTSSGQNFNAMFLYCYSLNSVPFFNTSQNANFNGMFQECRNLISVPPFNTSKGTNFGYMFYNCFSLTSVPLFDTSKNTSFSYMFFGCSNLTTVPFFDTSQGLYFNNMFNNCYTLTTIPAFNTSKGTDFSVMFYACYALTSVPLFDTSQGKYFNYMFYGCQTLTTIPFFNTSKGTDFSNMFYACYALTSVPLFDTSQGTNFSNMFTNCYSLTTIPFFNTSQGIDFSNMFSGCYALTNIPLLDTSKNTNFTGMFYNCFALTSIPLLNAGVGVNFNSTFLGCNSLASAALSGTRYTITYSTAPKLARQELVSIFNNLGTAVGAQSAIYTNCYGAASLTASDKLIATNKGWTLSPP